MEGTEREESRGGPQGESPPELSASGLVATLGLCAGGSSSVCLALEVGIPGTQHGPETRRSGPSSSLLQPIDVLFSNTAECSLPFPQPQCLSGLGTHHGTPNIMVIANRNV